MIIFVVVLYCIVLYYIVLYCIALHCIVLVGARVFEAGKVGFRMVE